MCTLSNREKLSNCLSIYLSHLCLFHLVLSYSIPFYLILSYSSLSNSILSSILSYSIPFLPFAFLFFPIHLSWLVSVNYPCDCRPKLSFEIGFWGSLAQNICFGDYPCDCPQKWTSGNFLFACRAHCVLQLAGLKLFFCAASIVFRNLRCDWGR